MFNSLNYLPDIKGQGLEQSVLKDKVRNAPPQKGDWLLMDTDNQAMPASYFTSTDALSLRVPESNKSAWQLPMLHALRQESYVQGYIPVFDIPSTRSEPSQSDGGTKDYDPAPLIAK